MLSNSFNPFTHFEYSDSSIRITTPESDFYDFKGVLIFCLKEENQTSGKIKIIALDVGANYLNRN